MADAVEQIPIELPFPIRGICDECPAYAQPELTTIDALNVCVHDSGGVARGGQRPGLELLWTVPEES